MRQSEIVGRIHGANPCFNIRLFRGEMVTQTALNRSFLGSTPSETTKLCNMLIVLSL